MALDFNKFASEGNEFIHELARKLGYPEDRLRAGRVLKAVLHALRNLLTTEESIQLMAQLPMFLKAVYADQWSTRKKKKKIRHMDELFAEIRGINRPTASEDFPTDDDIDNAIAMVFYVLRKYVSLGELEDIKSTLPKELKPIVNIATMI